MTACDVITGDRDFPGTPDRSCDLCPRLGEFLAGLRLEEPEWHNAPVPSFGRSDASFLVVGLAPGMKGANRTGRPFTGDYAGDLLYASLEKFGFATGEYDRRPDDGFTLINARVTNAVRCLPPENKPTGAEVRACGRFLREEIAAMPDLKVILVLGALSHGAVLTALGLKKKDYPFGHGLMHDLPDGRTLAISYHCSRYNTSTRRLTTEMFEEVISNIRDRLSAR